MQCLNGILLNFQETYQLLTFYAFLLVNFVAKTIKKLRNRVLNIVKRMHYLSK